ncbi:hypothetical protein GCM10027570_32710 [Streptomonospora sediminis]
MEGLFAADAAAEPAACAVALAAVLGAMGFLRRQYRRFGRLAGWSGRVTLALPVLGIGLLAFAVYPLPAPAAGTCTGGGVPPVPVPLETFAAPAAQAGAGARHTAAAAAVLLPVGLVLGYRYRRGLLVSAGLCALLAAAIEAVQLTGALGAYPCPYRTAAADDVLLGALGGLLGRLLAPAAKRLLPRARPGAVADFLPPDAGRRVLGRALDLAVCWYGACAAEAAAAALAPAAATALVAPGQVRNAALAVLVLVCGAAVPMLRRDRATPGQAACRLALSAIRPQRPAARPRVLLRGVLSYVPVAVLLGAGLGWWAPVVAVLHGSCALVRSDRAGLFDLVARTRVTTRAGLVGGLPDELVRYAGPGGDSSGAALPAAAGSAGGPR